MSPRACIVCGDVEMCRRCFGKGVIYYFAGSAGEDVEAIDCSCVNGKHRHSRRDRNRARRRLIDEHRERWKLKTQQSPTGSNSAAVRFISRTTRLRIDYRRISALRVADPLFCWHYLSTLDQRMRELKLLVQSRKNWERTRHNPKHSWATPERIRHLRDRCLETLAEAERGVM